MTRPVPDARYRPYRRYAGRLRSFAALVLCSGVLISGCAGSPKDSKGRHSASPTEATRGTSPTGAAPSTTPGEPTPGAPSSGATRPNTPQKSSSSPASGGLAGTDWRNVIDDIDCLAAGNEGIEVLDTQFADVRGTGVPDAFVTFDCVHQASTWPEQVEVFDGSSSPDAPRRIAVLVSAEEQVNGHGLRVAGGLSFSGKTVTVSLAAYGQGDPMCCPSQRLQRSFTWDGARFARKSAS